jgi:hypothetical protein
MPSQLINTTLSGLNMGVTQQFQEGRFDSQVETMFNCMPTLTRGVLRRNPIQSVRMLEELPDNLADAYVYSYDRGTTDEQYIIVIPGDGSIYTFNANTGSLVSKEIEKKYLQVPIGVRATDNFRALTLGDHTFILNRSTITKMLDKEHTSEMYSNAAMYWIKKTASVVTKQYQSDTEAGSLLQGYVYTLNGTEIRGTEDTRPDQPEEIHLNTGPSIATEFVANSNESLVTSNLDAKGKPTSICYTTNYVGTDWTWSDSFGDEASLGVWTNVRSSDKLPVDMPENLDGFQVKVSGGTSAEFDDYYLTYDYSNRSWKETPAPGIEYMLDPESMPHVLYRLGDGTFKFDEYKKVVDGIITPEIAWGERNTGGEDPLDDPSFLGKAITNLFFFKNRMGFITDSNIILSQTGAYGDYFVQTKQDVLDDDPIDLAVASTDVTVLRHAVPTSGQLILFADDTQFSLSSIEGALTPRTADITSLSNYTYGSRADAVSIGNRVLFSNQAGGYSQLFSYKITDSGSRLTEATPLTLHLPSYIDKSMVKIVGHDVLGYTFLETEVYPKELVVLSSVSVGEQELQNAFHRWTFTKNLVSTHIINDDLYILFDDGDLCRMTLEIPGDIRTVRYLDQYSTFIEPTPYKSFLIFSEFFLRDGNGKGTVRGRYQIRTIQYTVEDYSHYLTSMFNTDTIIPSLNSFGPTWVDTDVWDDNEQWTEGDTFYTRQYYDDDKVTVMGNSKNITITFSNNPLVPEKGFELATVNVEALFSQRSTRR